LGTLLKVGAYDYYGLKGLFTYRAFSTLKSTKGDTAALLNDILAPDMDADTKTALSRSVFGSLYSPKEEMMGKVERDYGVKIDRIRSKEQLDQISERIAPNRFEKNKNIQKIINLQF
jgi:cyclopropane fatty-acyl-phospholipid synthase-like methyltransferase